MLHARVQRPEELSAADLGAWRALQDATPAFASPLLGPEWAQAVGRVRRDAAVAVYRRGPELIGVLPHHRRPGGVARPIGAPWSDVHALVSGPDFPLSWREALAAAGVRSFRFSHLVDPHAVFRGVEQEAAAGHVIVFPPGADGEACWEALRAGSPKRFKNIRRLEHKLEREAGRLEFGPDGSRAAFDTLVAWKRAQFAQTGAHDVLHPAWSRALMDEVFALRQGRAQGRLFTLRAGGRLVAAHFGVQSGEVFHPWIAAYDSELQAYSPGTLFMSAAVRAAPGLGVRRYELGAGSDAYKTVFASGSEPVAAGVADLAGAPAPRLGPSLVHRLRRRLDHIAETEITLAGRVHGLAAAVAGVRRLASSPAPLGEPS